ncbi:protocadherin gamma-A8-like, partial [Limulus polyphemus]|uniref:Protocadherin gamma-A8-like n=1 Tax=Limulus polyphemus TaxID=6850 RepID=A0ABM1C3P3_LIMPO
MTVIAYDQGVPSLSSTAKLWITVSDTNDIVPEFPKSVYTLEVAESTKPGESIFQINAGTGPFRYYLKNKDEIDTFIIEELSGHIVLTKPLDSVHRSHYKLEVISSDDANPPKSDSTE